MMKVQTNRIINLQLANGGELWVARGDNNPQAVRDKSGFVSELSKTEYPHLRVMGSRENAPLIVDLYRKCCSPDQTGKLEAATPMLCYSDTERNDPEIVLYRMRQYLAAPSLGGWHKVTALDYPSYAIATHLDQDNIDKAREVLLTHPIHHDTAFIPTIDWDAVTQLTGTILDPRWYIDINHPYRLSKLKRYLGLTPRVMRKVLANEINCEQSIRCNRVLRCWNTQRPSPVDIERPGNFLWRRFVHHNGGWRGALVASQTFLAYFIRTWQQQLVNQNKQLQELQMFIPASLLQGQEVPAYQAHDMNRGL